MPTLTIRLDPRDIPEATADIRYELPDLLAERSGGSVRDDGYDYDDQDVMTIFLDVDERDSALRLIRDVVESEVVSGCHLGSAARVGTLARGEVKEHHGGLPHFARVAVIVEDAVATTVDISVEGSGFQRQGQTESASPDGYASWKAGAVQGCHYALRELGQPAHIIVTEIEGLATDTNPSIVALAAARATWNALAAQVSAHMRDVIEGVAFGSWSLDPASVPVLDEIDRGAT